MQAVLDTNILIDYLRGIHEAEDEINLYEKPVISLVTWMEILVGANDEEESKKLHGFLERFLIAGIDQKIAQHAVEIRQSHRIRLPDALIWGTARNKGLILVTRNTRDFPESHPSTRIPYLL